MKLVKENFKFTLGTSMKHVPKRPSVLLFTALAILGSVLPAHAENPNPFGNVHGGENLTPPPPPQFQDEDDIAPDGSGPI